MAERLSFRLELWLRARLMPFQLAQNSSLTAMLDLAKPPNGPQRFVGLPASGIVRAVRRTLRRPWMLRRQPCLREGLLTYRFLTEAGFQPQLHFGVDPGIVSSSKAIAHCWVTLDQKTVIGESPIPFVEVFSYPEHVASHGREP